MVNITKYRLRIKILHSIDENMLFKLKNRVTLLRQIIKEKENKPSKPDYINASIMLMNSLELKEAKKHIVKYKKSLR